MKAVFLRETRALFRGLTGWLVAASVLLAFAASIGLTYAAGADFRYAVLYALAAFIVIVPLYAGGGFSADRRSGADRLLRSLPLRPAGVVLGKYFARCTPFLGAMAVLCAYPPVAAGIAQVSMRGAYAGLALYALCGLALIALSLFLSMLTRSALLNALIALAALAAAYFIQPVKVFLLSGGLATLVTLVLLAAVAVLAGYRMTGSLTGALLIGLLAEGTGLICFNGNAQALAAFWNGVQSAVGVFARLNGYLAGMLDLGAVAYFLMLTALMLFFAAQRYRLDGLVGRRNAR